MGTVATIAVKTGKTYKSIRVYHEGYIAGVGRILRDNYTTTEDILKLMKLGDLFGLGTHPTDPGFYWKFNEICLRNYKDDYLWRIHAEVLDYYSISYKSHGYINVNARRRNSLNAVLHHSDGYIYAWDGMRWLYSDDGDSWQILDAALTEYDLAESRQVLAA